MSGTFTAFDEAVVGMKNLKGPANNNFFLNSNRTSSKQPAN